MKHLVEDSTISPPGRIWSGLVESTQSRRSGNLEFLLLSGGYILAVLLVMRAYDISYYYRQEVFDGYLLAGTSVIFALLGRVVWVTAKNLPEHPMGFALKDLYHAIRQRAGIGLPVLLVYPWFISAYMSLKASFIKITPFSWDPPITKLCLALHGGLPARWIIPYLSRPAVAWTLDVIYCSWFAVNAVCLTWMAFSLNFRLRRQFWTTFVLCWSLLGTVVAVAFLSGGPCFYQNAVGDPNPWAEQMAALNRAAQFVTIRSIKGQAMIWQWLGRDNLIGGASAMPSLHISTCVLFALVGWRANRWAGIALTCFAVATQIACVCLGWHYALDGYVAAIGTCILWWAAGLYCRRPCKQRWWYLWRKERHHVDEPAAGDFT